EREAGVAEPDHGHDRREVIELAPERGRLVGRRSCHHWRSHRGVRAIEDTAQAIFAAFGIGIVVALVFITVAFFQDVVVAAIRWFAGGASNATKRSGRYVIRGIRRVGARSARLRAAPLRRAP